MDIVTIVITAPFLLRTLGIQPGTPVTGTLKPMKNYPYDYLFSSPKLGVVGINEGAFERQDTVVRGSDEAYRGGYVLDGASMSQGEAWRYLVNQVGFSPLEAEQYMNLLKEDAHV